MATIRVFVADNHPATCVGIQTIFAQTTDLQVMKDGGIYPIWRTGEYDRITAVLIQNKIAKVA